MKSIALVNPNFEDSPLVRKGGIGIFFPNLGIDSIYTNLKSKYPDLPLLVVDGVLHNLSNEQTKEEILKKEPRIVGFSTTYMTLQDSLNIIREVKKEDPEVITVLGGVGAKSLKALSKGADVNGVDYCVIGDGERIFEKIIKENKKQNKTIYLQDIIYDLDRLEYPSRKAFDTEKYINVLQKVIPSYDNKNERYLNFYTSKGCYWGKCTFCTVDRHYRVRSPDKIAIEVKYLIEQFRITKLFTVDDNFFYFKNPERTYIICEILQEFPGLRWNVGETRVADFAKDIGLSKRILKKMRKSGCVGISWGVESGDPRLLKIMHKGIKPSEIETCIEMATKEGLISKLLLMYNLPSETKESLDNTLALVKSLILKYPINLLNLSEYANIPGTIDWYRGYNNDVSKVALERFRDELINFCLNNNVAISVLNWKRKNYGENSIRI